MNPNLVFSSPRLDKKDTATRDRVRSSVDAKSVLMLRYLASEYDDVSAAMFDFVRAYIQVCVNSKYR